MNEGVCLAVEVDPQHIQRRLETGYCDEMASTLDEALNQVREACNLGQPLSIGLKGIFESSSSRPGATNESFPHQDGMKPIPSTVFALTSR